MGRTEEREATIKMELRSEKAGTSKGSTASSEGGERRKRQEMEERAIDQQPVARTRTGASDDTGEQDSNDGLGDELDKKGRAGWEEGKKYQGADQKRDIQAAHKFHGWMSKHGKKYAWRQRRGRMATDP